MAMALKKWVAAKCCILLIANSLLLPQVAFGEPRIDPWGTPVEDLPDSEPPEPQPSSPQAPPPQSASSPAAPKADPVRFPSGSDIKVFEKTQAEINQLRQKLQQNETVGFNPSNLGTHPWYNANPLSEIQWQQDSRRALFGEEGQFLPGTAARNTPHAQKTFLTCFEPKVSYDLNFDLNPARMGCPYCPVPTKGKNPYMDLVSWACGVKNANDNRGYILEYWWPEYEIELNNFAISAFNPSLSCPLEKNPYTRTALSAGIESFLRPVFLREKAIQQGVREWPAFPQGLRSGKNLGQSAWEGVFPTDQTTNLEAHVYRTFLSTATSMTRPSNRDAGYNQKGGECCFYNALPPPPKYHPIVNGWTEQFPASAFWRTEELSRLFSAEAYQAVHPINTVGVRGIQLASQIPTGCAGYRAGQDFRNGNDYRDLITAVDIKPRDPNDKETEILKKICYPGGGDLFPLTGRLIGNFNRLPAAAYLSRRALYLFGEKIDSTATNGDKNPYQSMGQVVAPERRINRFNDRYDKLQRVYPGVSGCFQMKDVPNFLQDGQGDFPNDLIRPDQNGSIRFIYWNHRRACMCPKIGPAFFMFNPVTFFKNFISKLPAEAQAAAINYVMTGEPFLESLTGSLFGQDLLSFFSGMFCNSIRPACFSMMNGDKSNGEPEFNIAAIPGVPSPLPPRGVPYPFFENNKCKLCKNASSFCKKSDKTCGKFESSDSKAHLKEAPAVYLWLMRIISGIGTAINPSSLAPSLTSFLESLPGEIKNQLVGYLQQLKPELKDQFVSSVLNLPKDSLKRFLDVAKEFRSEEQLLGYFQSVSGMTPGEVEKYLKMMENLPEELKGELSRMVQTPEGREALLQLADKVAPGDLPRTVELLAGVDKEMLKEIANLDPKDIHSLLKIQENPALKGPLREILNNLGDGDLNRFLGVVDRLPLKDVDDFVLKVEKLPPGGASRLLTVLEAPDLRKDVLQLIQQTHVVDIPSVFGLIEKVDFRTAGGKEFLQLLKNEEDRKLALDSLKQYSPIDIPPIVDFLGNLSNEDYKKGLKTLGELDEDTQKKFVDLLKDPAAQRRLIDKANSVGFPVPTVLENYTRLGENFLAVSDRLERLPSEERKKFESMMSDVKSGKHLTNLINSAGDPLIAQVDSLLKMTESSLTALGQSLEDSKLTPEQSQSLAKLIDNPLSRDQLGKMANQFATEQLATMVKNLGNISSEQFQRVGGVLSVLPPEVQARAVSSMAQVDGGAAALAKHIETVGAQKFMQQANTLSSDQLAAEIKKSSQK